MRTLIEDEVYQKQAENLGYTDEQLDSALGAIVWALATDPEYYPVIPGTQRLRVTKTDPYSHEEKWIPALKVWYVIQDDGSILLKGITLCGDQG